MKSIVRRDTGEDWKQYVTRLMREDGTIEADEEPTDEEVRRYDKKRKNKRVSNEEWVSATDAESRITQLKDGRTHLAYKAEHVVDLESDMVLAAEIRKADEADTETLPDSVMEAQNNLNQTGSHTEIEEVAADKGYHAAHTLELCEALGLRTYIPEPRRKHRLRWTDKPAEYQHAVYANRCRIQRAKSKRWQRLRSEAIPRTSTFHLVRSSRFLLTHQRTARGTKGTFYFSECFGGRTRGEGEDSSPSPNGRHLPRGAQKGYRRIVHGPLSDIPQMDCDWTLLHAADDECTAVGSVDQGFSGSGKHSEPLRHLNVNRPIVHDFALLLRRTIPLGQRRLRSVDIKQFSEHCWVNLCTQPSRAAIGEGCMSPTGSYASVLEMPT